MKSKFMTWMGVFTVAAAVMTLGTASGETRAGTMPLAGCTATTAFSPNGEGVSLVVATIGSARKTIRMSTYSFTEPAIGKALLDARKRGVDVAIVVDKEHNGRRAPGTPSVARFLTENGVNVVLTRAYSIQHNKVVIVDGETVQTGSFNYSRAAQQSNAENVLVIAQCPKLASQYLRDWDKLYQSAGGEKVL